MNFVNIYIAVSLCYISMVVCDTFTTSRNKRTIGALFQTLVNAFQSDRQPEPQFKSYRPRPQGYRKPMEDDSEKNTQVKNEQYNLLWKPVTSNMIESGRSRTNSKLELSLLNTNVKTPTNKSPLNSNVEFTSSIENDITTLASKHNSSILNTHLFVQPFIKNENKDVTSDFLQQKNHPMGYHAQIHFPSPKGQFRPFISTSPIQNSADSGSPYVEENSFEGLQNYDSNEQVESTPIQEYIDDIPKVNEINISSEQIGNGNLEKVSPITHPKFEQEQKTEKPLFVPYFASEEAVKTENLESEYKVDKECTSVISNENTVEALQPHSHSSEKDKAKPLAKGSPVQSTEIEQERKSEYSSFLPYYPSRETVKPVNLKPEFKQYAKVPEKSVIRLPTTKTDNSVVSKKQNFNYYGSTQSGHYYTTDITGHNQQANLQHFILPNAINNNLEYKYQPGYHLTKPHHTPVYYTTEEYQQLYSIQGVPQHVQYQQYTSQERPKYVQYPSTTSSPGSYYYPPQYYGYKRFNRPHYCTSCRNKY